MSDILDQVENSLSAYNHALNIKNGNSAHAQRLHIEKNCTVWLSQLLRECRAHRKFGMTAETLGILNVIHEKEPMKLIYVCSPCRGNVRANISAARSYCTQVIAAGYIPIAPHVMFYDILDDNVPNQRAAGINMGIELLHSCNELWVFGKRISEGMSKEIELAENLRIPVKKVG